MQKSKVFGMHFIGEANSGKTTMIAESFCYLYMKIGYYVTDGGNFHFNGKEYINDLYVFHSNFFWFDFFLELKNARILVLDEAKIKPSDKNIFKRLLCGSSVTVAKKGEGAINTEMMPTAFLSNLPIVDMTDPVWSSRIAQFPMKTLTPEMIEKFVENGRRTINPLAWLDIFKELKLMG